MSTATHTCVTCGDEFERPDVAHCPFHEGTICSLCCSVERSCHDSCKTPIEIGGRGTATWTTDRRRPPVPALD
jgi:hypothetical protein